MSTAYAREGEQRDEAAAPGRKSLGLPSARTRTTVVVVVLGWVIGSLPLDDNSFLTHLRTGHWILGHGIPREDIYSYTVAGTSWIAQSWLAEVLYAGLDELTGPGGIRVLNGVVGATIAFLAARLAFRLRGPGPAAHLVFPALVASSLFWVERPLLLGILAFLVLIWIVEVPDSRVGRWPLLSIPVLMWLWVNIHGTFALGFGYLVLHLLGTWLDGGPPWQGRERRLLVAGGGGFAVCFLNPYGYKLVLFPLDLLSRGDALKHVQEWKSPDFRSAIGMMFAVWIVVFLCFLARSAGRPSRRDVLVSVVFLVLGLWALRNIAIAPLVGLPVAARLLPEARSEAPRRRYDLVIVATMLLGGALVTRASLSAPAFDYDRYPVTAMRVVEQKGLLGRRIFTLHPWSAYVIHRYWPRQSVFMDDRFDMYPVAFTENYMKVRRGFPEWRETFERYRVEVVVWETGSPLAGILSRDSSWQVIHRDPQATVIVRK
ncbi:hypothetical protein [Spirillospora sp. CA-294931]|uniref:hypothetical protein n=1 Tax=Spirillospora sp. CA-294931 TaxID=3240042 RepID=UPI003D91BF27